jgi:diaminohydroxyphosphoribosylaminopyrimidine deaminase / 5-amino-6-(5-phosphoribosylamino)uracil reductase
LKTSGEVTDHDFMARAILLAARGRGRTSPNPMVGALVVSADGVVVGSGYHEVAGGPHAEVAALHAAGSRARGATLYCTLEPCCHTGRTGPCTERLLEAGVRRVVAATRDPNPLVSGGGFEQLRRGSVEVTEGIGAPEALRLNRAFFKWIRTGRPHVMLKAAVTLENQMAGTAGVPLRITSAAADRHVHRERAAVDAIAVGSSTVLADDPRLTARGAWRSRALTRVVFDRRLRTPPTARLFSTCAAGPVIIMSTRSAVAALPERVRALEVAGAEIEAIDGERIAEALERLGARGVTSLVVEGGARLHEAFWQAAEVDMVRIYVAPIPGGGPGTSWLDCRQLPLLASAHRMQPEVIAQLGPDVRIDYVHRAD